MNIIHINTNVNISIAYCKKTNMYYFFYILYDIKTYKGNFLAEYLKKEKITKFLIFQHFLTIERQQYIFENTIYKNINFNTEVYTPHIIFSSGGNKSVYDKIKLCLYDNRNNLLFLIPIYHKYVKDKIKIVKNVLHFTTINITSNFSLLKYIPHNICALLNNKLYSTNLQLNERIVQFDENIINVALAKRKYYFRKLLKRRVQNLTKYGDRRLKKGEEKEEKNTLVIDILKMNNFIVILNTNGKLYLLSDDVYIASINFDEGYIEKEYTHMCQYQMYDTTEGTKEDEKEDEKDREEEEEEEEDEEDEEEDEEEANEKANENKKEKNQKSKSKSNQKQKQKQKQKTERYTSQQIYNLRNSNLCNLTMDTIQFEKNRIVEKSIRIHIDVLPKHPSLQFLFIFFYYYICKKIVLEFFTIYLHECKRKETNKDIFSFLNIDIYFTPNEKWSQGISKQTDPTYLTGNVLGSTLNVNEMTTNLYKTNTFNNENIFQNRDLFNNKERNYAVPDEKTIQKDDMMKTGFNKTINIEDENENAYYETLRLNHEHSNISSKKKPSNNLNNFYERKANKEKLIDPGKLKEPFFDLPDLSLVEFYRFIYIFILVCIPDIEHYKKLEKYFYKKRRLERSHIFMEYRHSNFGCMAFNQDSDEDSFEDLECSDESTTTLDETQLQNDADFQKNQFHCEDTYYQTHYANEIHNSSHNNTVSFNSFSKMKSKRNTHDRYYKTIAEYITYLHKKYKHIYNNRYLVLFYLHSFYDDINICQYVEINMKNDFILLIVLLSYSLNLYNFLFYYFDKFSCDKKKQLTSFFRHICKKYRRHWLYKGCVQDVTEQHEDSESEQKMKQTNKRERIAKFKNKKHFSKPEHKCPRNINKEETENTYNYKKYRIINNHLKKQFFLLQQIPNVMHLLYETISNIKKKYFYNAQQETLREFVFIQTMENNSKENEKLYHYHYYFKEVKRLFGFIKKEKKLLSVQNENVHDTMDKDIYERKSHNKTNRLCKYLGMHVDRDTDDDNDVNDNDGNDDDNGNDNGNGSGNDNDGNDNDGNDNDGNDNDGNDNDNNDHNDMDRHCFDDAYETTDLIEKHILSNRKMKYLHYFFPLFFPLTNLLVLSYCRLFYKSEFNEEAFADIFKKHVQKNELDVVYTSVFDTQFVDDEEEHEIEEYRKKEEYRKRKNEIKPVGKKNRNNELDVNSFITHRDKIKSSQQYQNDILVTLYEREYSNEERLKKYQQEIKGASYTIKYFDQVNVADITIMNILYKTVFFESLFSLHKNTNAIYRTFLNMYNLFFKKANKHQLMNQYFLEKENSISRNNNSNSNNNNNNNSNTDNKKRNTKQQITHTTSYIEPDKMLRIDEHCEMWDIRDKLETVIFDEYNIDLLKYFDIFNIYNFQNLDFYININREDLYFNKLLNMHCGELSTNFQNVLGLLNKKDETYLKIYALKNFEKTNKETTNSQKNKSENRRKIPKDIMNNNKLTISQINRKKIELLKNSYLSDYKKLKNCYFYFDTFKMNRDVFSFYFPQRKDPVLIYLNNFHNYYFAKYYRMRKMLANDNHQQETDAKRLGMLSNSISMTSKSSEGDYPFHNHCPFSFQEKKEKLDQKSIDCIQELDQEHFRSDSLTSSRNTTPTGSRSDSVDFTDVANYADLGSTTDSLESAYIYKHKYNKKNVNKEIKNVMKSIHLEKPEKKKILLDTNINKDTDNAIEKLHIYYTQEKLYKMNYICMLNAANVNFSTIFSSIHYKPRINFTVEYALYVYLFDAPHSELNLLDDVQLDFSQFDNLHPLTNEFDTSSIALSQTGRNPGMRQSSGNIANGINNEIGTGVGGIMMSNLRNSLNGLNGNRRNSSLSLQLNVNARTPSVSYGNDRRPRDSFERQQVSAFNESPEVAMLNRRIREFNSYLTNSNVGVNRNNRNSRHDINYVNNRTSEFTNNNRVSNIDFQNNFLNMRNSSIDFPYEPNPQVISRNSILNSGQDESFSLNGEQNGLLNFSSDNFQRFEDSLIDRNSMQGREFFPGRDSVIRRNSSIPSVLNSRNNSIANNGLLNYRPSNSSARLQNASLNDLNKIKMREQLKKAKFYLKLQKKNQIKSLKKKINDLLNTTTVNLKMERMERLCLLNKYFVQLDKCKEALLTFNKMTTEQILGLFKKRRTNISVPSFLSNPNWNTPSVPIIERENVADNDTDIIVPNIDNGTNGRNGESERILREDQLNRDEHRLAIETTQAMQLRTIGNSQNDQMRGNMYYGDTTLRNNVTVQNESPNTSVSVQSRDSHNTRSINSSNSSEGISETEEESDEEEEEEEDSSLYNVSSDTVSDSELEEVQSNLTRQFDSYISSISSDTKDDSSVTTANSVTNSNDDLFTNSFLYTPNKKMNYQLGNGEVAFGSVESRANVACMLSYHTNTIRHTEPLADNGRRDLWNRGERSSALSQQRRIRVSFEIEEGNAPTFNQGIRSRETTPLSIPRERERGNETSSSYLAHRNSNYSLLSERREPTNNSAVPAVRPHRTEQTNKTLDENQINGIKEKIGLYDFTFHKVKSVEFNRFVNRKTKNTFKLFCSLNQTIMYKRCNGNVKKNMYDSDIDLGEQERNRILIHILNDEKYLYKFLNKNYIYCGAYYLSGLIYGLGLLQFFKKINISIFFQYILKFKNRNLYICAIIGICLSFVASQNTVLSSIFTYKLLKELNKKCELNFEKILFHCVGSNWKNQQKHKTKQILQKKGMRKKEKEKEKITNDSSFFNEGKKCKNTKKGNEETKKLLPFENSYYYNVLCSWDVDLFDTVHSTTSISSDETYYEETKKCKGPTEVEGSVEAGTQREEVNQVDEHRNRSNEEMMQETNAVEGSLVSVDKEKGNQHIVGKKEEMFSDIEDIKFILDKGTANESSGELELQYGGTKTSRKRNTLISRQKKKCQLKMEEIPYGQVAAGDSGDIEDYEEEDEEEEEEDDDDEEEEKEEEIEKDAVDGIGKNNS